MTVSVVIPTYNRAYILPEAIASVLQQSHGDLDVIIVDDGSVDHTPELLARISDPRLRVIRHPQNLGYSAALNTGVTAAIGEFISFLDSDDLWVDDKLERELAFLSRHDQIGGVFCDMQAINGSEIILSRARLYPLFSKLLGPGAYPNGLLLTRRQMYICLLQEVPLKIQGALFRREAVNRTGLFLASWHSGSDWEFLLRFSRHYALGYIDRPLAVLRTLDDSTLARHKKEDASNLLARFIEEAAGIDRDDIEARSAVRRGVALFGKELGWQYLHERNRSAAREAYVRSFRASGDFSLLVRAGAAFLPSTLRSFTRDIKQRLSGRHSRSVEVS